MKSVGIIGYGNFGKLIEKHLAPHFDVRAYDKEDSDKILKSVCQSDVVIFAIPFFSLQEVIEKTRDLIPNSSLIADVTSIKVKPVKMLSKVFPNHQIIATHPIFGPQSGKDGIVGLPIVIHNVSANAELYRKTLSFFKDTLELKVIEQTPDQHDREMAYIQGMAHFIGRALKNLDIKDYETSTFSYHQLVELTDLLREDSWELFRTIQEGNPYAEEVRKELMSELGSLEKRLDGDDDRMLS